MASLDYGMYGFNIINPNGETSQRVWTKLETATNGSISSGSTRTVIFSTVSTDGYTCACLNSDGTSSAARTPASGIYRVRSSVTSDISAAATDVTMFLYVDKQYNFNSGTFDSNASGSYLARASAQSSATGTTNTVSVDETLFLEKDCYVSVRLSVLGGTCAPKTAQGYAFLYLELISTENSEKSPLQVY